MDPDLGRGKDVIIYRKKYELSYFGVMDVLAEGDESKVILELLSPL